MATAANSRCPCGAPAGTGCRSMFCLRNRPLFGTGEHTHSGSLVQDASQKLVALVADRRPAAAPADPPTIVEGVVVRFKSGGPRMTVEDVRSDGGASVVWFSGSDEAGWQLHRQATIASALELAAD